jgi:hypothetical protein
VTLLRLMGRTRPCTAGTVLVPRRVTGNPSQSSSVCNPKQMPSTGSSGSRSERCVLSHLVL